MLSDILHVIGYLFQKTLSTFLSILSFPIRIFCRISINIYQRIVDSSPKSKPPPPPLSTIPPFLEIACFNHESAVTAIAAGAHRIELCLFQALGGLTPNYTTLWLLRSAIKERWGEAVKVPVFVMIRDYHLSFVYTKEVLAQMEKSIEGFVERGVDGFVFGVLTPEGRVDEEANRRLIGKAGGKPCTFHRAFDEIAVEEMEEQLDKVIDCGFRSLLTSGGGKNAVEGGKVLKRLVERAGDRIDVIVGGGVRSGNLEELRETTGARWYHSSAVLENEKADEEEVKLLKEMVDR